MPADHSLSLTPQTLGSGVVDPGGFQRFSSDAANVVRLYHDDPDASVVVWNLEPGQTQGLHRHPANLHVFYVLTGEGTYRRGEDGPDVPVRAGQCVIIPRTRSHAIVNTGTQRLSYLAISTYGPDGYVRAEP
ncbi:MAG: cupin domain-containing protein [Chloroflexota bacterium]